MLEGIDDNRIFTYFEEISNIPRGSYHNEKISAYLVEFAKKHQLRYRVDEALNVIMWKPASAGCERKAPVMLQGHMDMVCVSEDGHHDFENEGLKLRVQGDMLDAENTTLGGDDGIALAYMLAILSGEDYVHPPIEAVFTTDEEVGMGGASKLDVSGLEAKYLINLDNEEEGVLLVSCAGGASADIAFCQERVPASGNGICIRVSGLSGGHSGTEIARHPLNASVCLARILAKGESFAPLRLISFTGGDKDNVITNSASAEVLCQGDEKAFIRQLEEYVLLLKEEVLSAQPGIQISISSVPASGKACFTEEFTKTVLRFMNLSISGVQVMSSDVPGMVESSLNMGIAGTKEDGMYLGFSVRSQKESYLDYMLYQLESVADTVCAGTVSMSFQVRGRYAAWDFRKDSRLREIMEEEFYRLFGRKPAIEGIHAGLECGILSKKLPELDIVSMGPDIFDIHTVKERMSISSAKRNFDLVLHVLERLAE